MSEQSRAKLGPGWQEWAYSSTTAVLLIPMLLNKCPLYWIVHPMCVSKMTTARARLPSARSTSKTAWRPISISYESFNCCICQIFRNLIFQRKKQFCWRVRQCNLCITNIFPPAQLRTVTFWDPGKSENNWKFHAFKTSFAATVIWYHCFFSRYLEKTSFSLNFSGVYKHSGRRRMGTT